MSERWNANLTHKEKRTLNASPKYRIGAFHVSGRYAFESRDRATVSTAAMFPG